VNWLNKLFRLINYFVRKGSFIDPVEKKNTGEAAAELVLGLKIIFVL
jgi:hypothetical protein